MPLHLLRHSLFRFVSLLAMSLGFVAVVANWGDAAEVKLASQPTLSPNGDRLAFVWQDNLWMVNGTGGRARRLTFSDSRESQPKFHRMVE